MRVAEIMTRDVRVVRPDDSLRKTAEIMASVDTGAVPVCNGDELVGMVTDRDMATRAIAQGKSADTPVREIMTDHIHYCFEDEELDHVAETMTEAKVRRLPVVDRHKKLVGIVSLGDLSQGARKDTTAEAVSEISRPGGPHTGQKDGGDSGRHTH